MDSISRWWAGVPTWAKPVLLTAGIAVAVGILAWILKAAMRIWFDHLVEKTLREIDSGLAKRIPSGANIFERDVKSYLGFWRFLRFSIMERLEKRGFVERVSGHFDGAVWLRRS